MSDEYPKRNCEYFYSYLGICGRPESHCMVCREEICPLIKEAE